MVHARVVLELALLSVAFAVRPPSVPKHVSTGVVGAFSLAEKSAKSLAAAETASAKAADTPQNAKESSSASTAQLAEHVLRNSFVTTESTLEDAEEQKGLDDPHEDAEEQEGLDDSPESELQQDAAEDAAEEEPQQDAAEDVEDVAAPEEDEDLEVVAPTHADGQASSLAEFSAELEQKEQMSLNTSASSNAAVNASSNVAVNVSIGDIASANESGTPPTRTFAQDEGEALLAAVKGIRSPLKQTEKAAVTTRKGVSKWAEVPDRMQAAMGLMKEAVAGTEKYLTSEHKRVETGVKTRPQDVLNSLILKKKASKKSKKTRATKSD